MPSCSKQRSPGQAFARSWTSIAGWQEKERGARRVPFGYEGTRSRHDNQFIQGCLSRSSGVPPLRLGARRAGGGVHNAPAIYDEERIRECSRMIGYAIDARRQRFPDETPYTYRPFADSGEVHRWTPDVNLKDYNLLDLSVCFPLSPRRTANRELRCRTEGARFETTVVAVGSSTGVEPFGRRYLRTSRMRAPMVRADALASAVESLLNE